MQNQKEVVYYVAASLDGFIADKNGGVDWLEGFEDGMAGYDAFFASIDLLVMGRTTYDQVCDWGEWPYGDKPTVIVTRRQGDLPLGNTTRVPPDADLLRDVIQSSDAQRIWLVGGAQTAALMAEAGLITTLEIYIIPKILGGGVPLFGDGFPATKLELETAEHFESGMIRTLYRMKT
jgi:dihydrofolate reductase